MYNPFDGINPGLGPFGAFLKSPISILLSLAWALALVYAGYQLVVALGQLASARRQHRPGDAEEAAGRIMWPAIAVIGLFAVPAIWAVLSSIK